MKPVLKRIFESPWLAGRLEVVLGMVFIVASLHKIADPPDFAHMIYNYKITPNPFINLVAIYMPWIELFAGLALVCGVFGRRGGATIVGGLLVVFMLAIGFNLLRGNAIDCGCFEGSGETKTRAQLLLEMWWVLFRDALMLLGVAQILVAGRAEERRAAAPSAPRPEPVRA